VSTIDTGMSTGPAATVTDATVAAYAAPVCTDSTAVAPAFRRGGPAAEVHIVRSGRIELSRIIGRRHVTLQELRAGDVFGDVPAFLGEAEPFDVRNVQDSVIHAIDMPALHAWLQTRPLVAQRWFISLAERMATVQQRLIGLSAGGLETQLASLLLREAGLGDAGTIRSRRWQAEP